MRTWLRAKAILPWVEHPTMVSIYSQADKGEVVDMYSTDDGKTWVIPYGMVFRPDQVKFVDGPVRYRYRWTWKGRVEERVPSGCDV